MFLVFCLGKISSPVQNNIINQFIIFVATKNGREKKLSPSFFSAVVRFEIRIPRWIKSGTGIQDTENFLKSKAPLATRDLRLKKLQKEA